MGLFTKLSKENLRFGESAAETTAALRRYVATLEGRNADLASENKRLKVDRAEGANRQMILAATLRQAKERQTELESEKARAVDLAAARGEQVRIFEKTTEDQDTVINAMRGEVWRLQAVASLGSNSNGETPCYTGQDATAFVTTLAAQREQDAQAAELRLAQQQQQDQLAFEARLTEQRQHDQQTLERRLTEQRRLHEEDLQQQLAQQRQQDEDAFQQRLSEQRLQERNAAEQLLEEQQRNQADLNRRLVDDRRLGKEILERRLAQQRQQDQEASDQRLDEQRRQANEDRERCLLEQQRDYEERMQALTQQHQHQHQQCLDADTAHGDEILEFRRRANVQNARLAAAERQVQQLQQELASRTEQLDYVRQRLVRVPGFHVTPTPFDIDTPSG